MKIRGPIRAATLAAILALPVAAAAATLEVVEPSADEILYGPTQVRVRYEGKDTLNRVEFYVDHFPRAVCVVRQRPYRCRFDAGTDFQGRLIRVRAIDVAGATIAESTMQTLAFPAPERVAVRTLQVPVVATGTAATAPELTAKSLTCRFADKRCRVVDVREIVEATTIPVSLEMLIDVSGSVRANRDELLRAVEMVIDNAPVGVDIATTEFGATYSRVGEFTSDKEALRRAIGSLDSGQPNTCLVAAIQRSLRSLARLPGHKLLFVISDGEETCAINPFLRLRSELAHSDPMWDVVTLAREVGVPVYIYRYERVGGRDIPRSSFAKSYEGVARESGGRLFAIGSVTSLVDALSDLMDDLHNTWIVDIDLPDIDHETWKRRLWLKTAQPEASLRYPEYWRAEHREEEIIGMLASPDPATRSWAADEIDAGHTREVIDILIRAVKREKHPEALQHELSALGRVSSTLLVHGTPADRRAAVRAIETLHEIEPHSLETLEPVLRLFPKVESSETLQRRLARVLEAGGGGGD